MGWLLRPPARGSLVLLGAAHLPWLVAEVLNSFCRSGFRKNGVHGKVMAVVATGFHTPQTSRITGSLGGEIFHNTEQATGQGSSAGFNIGGGYNFDEHNHLLFSAGKGLRNATLTNQSSTYLAYQRTWYSPCMAKTFLRRFSRFQAAASVPIQRTSDNEIKIVSVDRP